MTENSAKEKSNAHRALPVGHQIRILIGIAVIVAIGVALTVVIGTATTTPTAAQPSPSATGNYKPTPSELTGLVIKPVEQMSFRSETITEGSIAADDNLTTPVFSPLSGRVSQIVANLGDRVASGAPLLSIEASEIAQEIGRAHV